ncbi:MAG: ATP-binding protein [Spirochaetes bacterium]|nr:ATP-binding protein [Spirochaetota bacterium]
MRILKSAKKIFIKNWIDVSPEKQRRIRVSVISILLLICFALNFFCYAVLKSGVVFSHFFYIPIVLSALWWRRRGIWVAVILSAVFILSSHMFFHNFTDVLGNYMRASIFMLISVFVALLAEEKEKKTRALSALCSIYTAFNTSEDLGEKMQSAMEEIKRNLPVNGVAIFILEPDGRFSLRYSYGIPDKYEFEMECYDNQKIMSRVAGRYEFVIFEDLYHHKDKFSFISEGRIKSTAYSPIISKEQKVIGIIQLFSPKEKIFSGEERSILELIGNRIGAAIENSFLYDNYKKSEEKYKSLFNSDPNPIFILDSGNLKIIDFNSRALECYGYNGEEMLGLTFTDLGDDGERTIQTSLKSLRKGDSIFIARSKHFRKDKTQFYVNINVSSTRYSGGYALIATTTNVTDSVHRDMQLIQASKMTTVGTMAAGMAHELSQPLNVIMIGSDFILKKARKGESLNTGDFVTVAEELSVSVQRAAQIIRHMRDFSRQSDSTGSPIDINTPIRDVFKILGQQLKVHEIEVKLNLDESLPPVFANHNRMEQVFMNLITNAMDAMDEKGEKIRDPEYRKVLTIDSFIRDNRVVVSVSDNGIGIPEENTGRIFEPFFTTKEVGRGTGLGTSISYGIVKDYGGTIDVISGVYKGTIFELRFPVYKN